MESLEFEALDDYRKLYDHVRRHLRGTAQSYLFVDEVQNVFEWERAIASVLADGFADVTISGLNARLLSSELATRLTGRYVEIPVYPLLFSEFIAFRGIERSSPDVQRAWTSHPKLVLSLDTSQPTNRNGIRWQNLIDFLLQDDTP